MSVNDDPYFGPARAPMTRDAFWDVYTMGDPAVRAALVARDRAPRPCRCGASTCPGWQMAHLDGQDWPEDADAPIGRGPALPPKMQALAAELARTFLADHTGGLVPAVPFQVILANALETVDTVLELGASGMAHPTPALWLAVRAEIVRLASLRDETAADRTTS